MRRKGERRCSGSATQAEHTHKDAPGLQAVLDALHVFCQANHLTVNTTESVAVTFHGVCPKAKHAPAQYAGLPLPVQDKFT